MLNKRSNGIDKIISQHVKVARKQAGLSQEQVAAKLGVTFQQIQKYENGSNRVAPGRLMQIAEITGRSVAWFFGEVKAPAGTDIVMQLLAAPYGVDLARAYLAIPRNRDRHAVMEIARTVAEASSTLKADAA